MLVFFLLRYGNFVIGATCNYKINMCPFVTQFKRTAAGFLGNLLYTKITLEGATIINSIKKFGLLKTKLLTFEVPFLCLFYRNKILTFVKTVNNVGSVPL